MNKALDLLKTEPSAIWTLLGFSLAYGVFHAAGPGHGKAVIAAYGLMDKQALSKIVGMAMAAALLQGLIAISLVSLLAAVLHSTAASMRVTAENIEMISFGAIALFGAGLLWQKSRDLARLVLPHNQPIHHEHDHHTHHTHGAHHAHHAHHTNHDNPIATDHVHDEHCGHTHAPVAAAGSGFRGAAAAVIAAGIRPCSGSILILVFALSQGMFAIGIAAAMAIAVGTALTTSTLAVLSILALSTATRIAARIDQSRAIFLAKALEVGISALVMALGLALLLGFVPAAGA
jgi:ABC-type nickel/cobalt efflux system permease component RcnA